MNKAERIARARLAVETSWEKTEDRSARTAPARAAFEARFANEAERKAYYSALALKSARVRRAKAAGRKSR